MKNIAIIGAGLSGMLAVLNLLKLNSQKESVSIKQFDARGEEDLGPAYSTSGDYLLNVPAAVMGAISSPEHFYNWLIGKNISVQKTDFIPRKIYREYIFELFSETLNKKPANKQFERIQGEVTDIEFTSGTANIFLEDGRSFIANKILLAIGNFPPPNPVSTDLSYLNCPFYFGNPWRDDLFSNLSREEDIFFIGTGQTTVDLAAGLYRQGHRGRLFAISRRGFLPMPHNKFDVYPQFYDEIKNLNSVVQIFKIIRKHIKKAVALGLDIRSVIDSLRPYTVEIWLKLPVEEKHKFLRHLFRYWEIIRSRIPPETDAAVKQMQASGQLKIIAGRISDLAVKEKCIDVCYTQKETTKHENQPAHLVVNCMGPELDYNKIGNPLIANLLKRGLIVSDPVNIGLNADFRGAVIHKDGTVSNKFFAIGMPLRGVLWECIAAPEIRVHAEKLAKILLK